MSRTWPDPAELSQWFGDYDTPEQKRAIRAAYYESITCVDQAVGRVLDHLEERGQLDNALIVFTSDHGEMLQDKGYYSKELPYEGAVRVPLIVKFPNDMQRGEVRHDFVDTLDILPTCLDVAGIDYPSGQGRSAFSLPGRSLAHDCTRDIQISSTFEKPVHRWVMARTRRYKYVYKYNGACEELYDLESDPQELHPIVNEGVRNRLRDAVIAWETQWGPDWAVRNGRLSEHPAVPHHPAHSGKFHLWANAQVQQFDRRAPDVRGDRLTLEMKHAVSDAAYSGVTCDTVFDSDEWLTHLSKSVSRYATQEHAARLGELCGLNRMTKTRGSDAG